MQLARTSLRTHFVLIVSLLLPFHRIATQFLYTPILFSRPLILHLHLLLLYTDEQKKTPLSSLTLTPFFFYTTFVSDDLYRLITVLYDCSRYDRFHITMAVPHHNIITITKVFFCTTNLCYLITLVYLVFL